MSEVLVLVDHLDGEIKKVTHELLTAARTLGEPSALVLECTAMFPFAAEVRRACGLPVFELASLAGVIAAELTATAQAHA